MTRKRIEFLSKLWLAWIWTYLILGGIASMNGRTSFLAAAVDSPLPIWFKLLFLNVPLQIALALAASCLLARNPEDQPSGFTVTLSFAATFLIGVNLVTAFCLFV